MWYAEAAEINMKKAIKKDANNYSLEILSKKQEMPIITIRKTWRKPYY